MAGFDEAPVYYNDQNDPQPWNENYLSTGLTRAAAQAKFEEFLRTYYRDSKSLQEYSEELLKDKKKIKIDLCDLRNFDIELAHAVREDPAYYLPLLEKAANAVLSKFHFVDENGQEQDFSGLQVMLHSSKKFGPSSLRELMAEHVSKLVMIPGIITTASNPKHKATHLCIQCKDCKNLKVIMCKPGLGAAAIPRTCEANVQAGPGAPEGCSLDPYHVIPSRSKFIDTQRLKIQEQPEDVPTGELPRSMQLVVDRNLVGQVAPGTRVTICGIYSIYQAQGDKRQNSSGVAIRMPYLRVVGMQEDNEGVGGSSIFSRDEEQEFKQYASRPNVCEQIFASMAPNIYGHVNVKKALACLLFGGSRKRLPDGTYRRGDINLLLMGDPSTAKSQFLKFASKTAPIAVYTSGKGSSAAGLTATVIRNAAGDFYLEGGAMVLADNGIVCIDEFDKMRPEDRVAIHEAMEQQTISVAKAGITTMLKSRTSVLAAANPPTGRYDDLKSAQENIGLQSTILSRFDMIFIVKDERSVDRDKQIAKHVLNVHKNAGANVAVGAKNNKALMCNILVEVQHEENFLRRYLEYARLNCSPRLSETASELLIQEYVELREEVRNAANGTGSNVPAIPITVRQLEAIIRISESLAKMQLMNQATEFHVRQAIELFKYSTMDAVRSGIIDLTIATEEQRAELHAVEAQIKRRIAIGSYVSERKLVDELLRIGLNEGIVKRALLYLSETNELEYVRERRMLHRLK